MKPTLFILAAGMGSRYGGLKQIDKLGPSGETIVDYSVYDAIRAGFGSIVFVIRKDFEQDFNEVVLSKYADKIPCKVCFQGIDNVPSGYSYNPERVKPWGTNHAVLMGKECINTPFAVINSDDFYGRESFEILANYLTKLENTQNQYCMVGYRLENTLSSNGSVNRGVCAIDGNGFLTDIVEKTNIEGQGLAIVSTENGVETKLEKETLVSMNMWGFTVDYFDYTEDAFKDFLTKHGQELKSEFYIPTLVNTLIKEKKVTCKVLDTPSTWFGVTYPEDRSQVIFKINELISQGVYPQKLFA